MNVVRIGPSDDAIFALAEKLDNLTRAIAPVTGMTGATLRAHLDTLEERLIAVKDHIDGDPDAEDEPDLELLADPGDKLHGAPDDPDRELDAADWEPSLCSLGG